MFLSRKTPLAWSNLVHNKIKLFGALSSVTFAVTLMFMEMGFRNALLDGMVGLIRNLDADLVLVARTSCTTGFKKTIPRERLYEAAQSEGSGAPAPLTSSRRVPSGGTRSQESGGRSASSVFDRATRSFSTRPSSDKSRLSTHLTRPSSTRRGRRGSTA